MSNQFTVSQVAERFGGTHQHATHVAGKHSSETADLEAKEIMAKVAELLLETAVQPRSRRETKKAMQKIKRLMRKYGDLKIAERNLPAYYGGRASA